MSYHDKQKESLQQLKDQLGWADGSTSDLVGELTSTVMVLCDRVAQLESRVERLENPEECGLAADYKHKYK